MNTKEKILAEAITLFAQKGYAGLSMRHLAQAAEVSVAAIYHHFPDKQALYLATTRYAFSGKESVFAQVWEADCPPAEKLKKVIFAILNELSQDNDFRRLVQREIMEADSERMRWLAQGVFKNQFELFLQLAAELAPKRNAFLVATSIVGLLKVHLDHQPLNRHFPGWMPEYDQSGVIAEHIADLLLQGLAGPCAT